MAQIAQGQCQKCGRAAPVMQVTFMRNIGLVILRLTQSEECPLDDLMQCLQVDPALTGRLLKLANSPPWRAVVPLTTVRQPKLRLGYAAMDLMQGLLRGEPPENKRLRAELIARASTSAPVKTDKSVISADP